VGAATGGGFPTASGMDLSGASGASVSAGARTNTAWTDTNRAAPPGRTAAFLFGGLGVAALLGGGAFLAFRTPSSALSEPAASASPTTAQPAAKPAAAPTPVEISP